MKAEENSQKHIPKHFRATSHARRDRGHTQLSPTNQYNTDINDGPPLTPSHFLCGHRHLMLPDTLSETEYEDSEYTPKEPVKDLTKRMKYHQKMALAFWKQWQKEYLTNLREQLASHKTNRNQKILWPKER